MAMTYIFVEPVSDIGREICNMIGEQKRSRIPLDLREPLTFHKMYQDVLLCCGAWERERGC